MIRAPTLRKLAATVLYRAAAAPLGGSVDHYGGQNDVGKVLRYLLAAETSADADPEKGVEIHSKQGLGFNARHVPAITGLGSFFKNLFPDLLVIAMKAQYGFAFFRARECTSRKQTVMAARLWNMVAMKDSERATMRLRVLVSVSRIRCPAAINWMM